MSTLFKITLKETVTQLASTIEYVEADSYFEGKGQWVTFYQGNTRVALYNRDVIKKITAS